MGWLPVRDAHQNIQTNVPDRNVHRSCHGVAVKENRGQTPIVEAIDKKGNATAAQSHKG